MGGLVFCYVLFPWTGVARGVRRSFRPILLFGGWRCCYVVLMAAPSDDGSIDCVYGERDLDACACRISGGVDRMRREVAQPEKTVKLIFGMPNEQWQLCRGCDRRSACSGASTTVPFWRRETLQRSSARRCSPLIEQVTQSKQ